MGNYIGHSTGEPDISKYDPWSKTLMKKDAFFAKWCMIYEHEDLEDCWLNLRAPKKWDPWSAAHTDKETFMAKWSLVYKNRGELEKCWEELHSEKIDPYPNFLKWPVRQQVMRLLGDVSQAETYAVVSLIYGDATEALAQGLTLGCSLAGKTKYPRILLHTPDVPAKHLGALRHFWKLLCVAPIAGSSRLTSKMKKFKNVFTKLHIFDKEKLPFDRVLFLDLDTLVVAPLDEVLETGHTLAAVGCPTGYTYEGIDRKKKLRISTPEGAWMKPGDTFNGGVMLVSPQQEVFKLLSTDCQTASNWHYPTTYPESHYLKWVSDWRSLSPSLNLCPRMGKGQANTLEWQEMSWQQVKIFHFSTQSKPYYWFKVGTIQSMHSSADNFPEELTEVVEMRAQRAYNLWIFHLALALTFMAIRRKKVLVLCLLTKDWNAYIDVCKFLLKHYAKNDFL